LLKSAIFAVRKRGVAHKGGVAQLTRASRKELEDRRFNRSFLQKGGVAQLARASRK